MSGLRDSPAGVAGRPIFLIGFMASGKSTVGRELAVMLERPFVDLDQMIELGAGKDVGEIFAEHGEVHFRRLEAVALGETIAGPAAVVATGGGAPCYERGLERMREAGLVISLDVSLERTLERVSSATDAADRPLLLTPVDELRALYQARQPIYRQAHVAVRTDLNNPREVAQKIAGLVAAASEIPGYALPDASLVSLGRRACPILVASGSLGRVGELAWRALGRNCQRVGLISDSNVAPLYAERVRSSLEQEGFEVVEAVIPAGEGAKTFTEFERLCGEMVAGALDRSSAIIALGGGVVGDLAGYVAASLYRGVRVVQVPTTVLAMVDSAIGGKTGINIEAGKNLVGAFWQPSFVLADPEVLTTLPVRERRAAFGELIKYALLDSEDLLALVEQIAPAMAVETEEVPRELTEVIRRCAAIKSWIVSRDEREETGERALLNLGHTVGHAIEAAAGYGGLLHGEAVALGLIASCRVSAALGLADPELEGVVAATLERAGLDADLGPWLRDDVIARIGVDKKRTGSALSFVTLRGVGAPGLTSIELGELKRILHD